MARGMRVLVFGATGLVGQTAMVEGRARGHLVVGAARHNADRHIDFSAAGTEIDTLISEVRPDLVINAAAMTDLNDCQSAPDLAHRVNVQSVEQIARSCERIGARLMQISTDHYFTGHGREPHDETATCTLVNHYARTKFEGEQIALAASGALVVRTNVTGFRGWPQPTFVEWAIDALLHRKPITLFEDYFTSTINSSALARALFDLAERDLDGLLNVASSEISSKQQFVGALAQTMDIDLDWATTGSVKSLTIPRAESLGLDVSRAEAILGYRLPDLNSVVTALAAEAS